MKTVPFTPTGCVLHKAHKPKPSRLEKHHVLPLYLAKRIGIESTETVLVCESGHTDTHVALNALLIAGAPMPSGIGTAERRLARVALMRYVNAGGSVPL